MNRLPIQPLIDLGLTKLESEIYAYLLENSPATGYRVGKAIGRPTANTYKALQSLQHKGAVIVEDSTKRNCRAVPMDTFLEGLEKKFFHSKHEARKALAKLKPAPDDERLYHLHTPDQVFEHFRQMLHKCQQVALFDLFPLPLDQMKSDIESAASRGIRIAVKTYQSCTIRGAEVVTAFNREKTMERWSGQWANGVTDGKEHVLAFLSKEGTDVHQAVWSTNTYISWVYHSSLMHELLHDVLLNHIGNVKGNASLSDKYKRLESIKAEEAPGYRTLVEHFFEEENAP